MKKTRIVCSEGDYSEYKPHVWTNNGQRYVCTECGLVSSSIAEENGIITPPDEILTE